MNEVNGCPTCGERDTSDYDLDNGVEIFQCSGCGTWYDENGEIVEEALLIA